MRILTDNFQRSHYMDDSVYLKPTRLKSKITRFFFKLDRSTDSKTNLKENV